MITLVLKKEIFRGMCKIMLLHLLLVYLYFFNSLILCTYFLCTPLLHLSFTLAQTARTWCITEI